MGLPNRKGSYSNHPFLGAKMLVSGRVIPKPPNLAHIALHCVWRQARMPMPRMPTCLVIYVGTSAFGRKSPVEKKAKPKPHSDHGIWCKIWQWLTKPWQMLRSSCFQSQEMILRVLTSSRSVKTNVLITNNKKPCKFGLTITRFLRIWVAADVKYLDFAYPAYVEHEKAKHTSHGITHRVSTIAHARHNWTLNWHGAIFLDNQCQVNSIAFSCFQAFTCPSPKKCRKSVDITSIFEVVSEICCQKTSSMIHD